LPGRGRSVTRRTGRPKSLPSTSGRGSLPILPPEPDHQKLPPGMVGLKASDAETYVARPDPGRPIALLFGADAGLVSERAEAMICTAVDDIKDPFACCKITRE